MNRAYGAAALVRVINPDCELQEWRGARAHKQRDVSETRIEVYAYRPFFVCACKRQVPQTHDVVAVPVTSDDLPVTGKENHFGARVHGKKKKGESC
jgi:hypothetical protein